MTSFGKVFLWPDYKKLTSYRRLYLVDILTTDHFLTWMTRKWRLFDILMLAGCSRPYTTFFVAFQIVHLFVRNLFTPLKVPMLVFHLSLIFLLHFCTIMPKLGRLGRKKRLIKTRSDLLNRIRIYTYLTFTSCSTLYHVWLFKGHFLGSNFCINRNF